MNHSLLAFVIGLANCVVLAAMYQTLGWHFIRGYNEVGNFLVLPVVIAHAGLNLMLVIVALLGPIVAKRWKRGDDTRWLATGFAASALIILLSPLIAPALGKLAARNRWIKTPLVEAARYGDARLVIILLTHGADPNVRDRTLGTTALHYTAAQGEDEAVRLLLERGADPNAAAGTSLETPLHWAVRSRASLSTIRLLAAYGANPSSKDWKGRTPMDYTDVVPDPKGARILEVFGMMPIGEPAEEYTPTRE